MMFERGPEFEALVDNPRIVDLIEALLGPDCHLIAMSALRDHGWSSTARWPASAASKTGMAASR